MKEGDTYIKQPESSIENPFLLSVESSLVVRGCGTVVTGKVEHGQLNVNDELDLVSSIIRKTACLGIEMFRKSLDSARAGDNIGILLKNIKEKEVSRGDMLSSVGAINAYNTFKCKVYFLLNKEGG